MSGHSFLESLDDVAEGVIVVRDDHIIEFINSAAAGMLKTAQSEAVGRKCCEVMGLSGVCDGPNCPAWAAIHGYSTPRKQLQASLSDGTVAKLDIRSVLYRRSETASSAVLFLTRPAGARGLSGEGAAAWSI